MLLLFTNLRALFKDHFIVYETTRNFIKLKSHLNLI